MHLRFYFAKCKLAVSDQHIPQYLFLIKKSLTDSDFVLCRQRFYFHYLLLSTLSICLETAIAATRSLSIVLATVGVLGNKTKLDLLLAPID